MRQWLAFQKTVLDSSIQSMDSLQDHVANQIMACIDMNPFLPPEGKKLIAEWLQTYRQGCDGLKTSVEASYKKASTFFDGPPK